MLVISYNSFTDFKSASGGLLNLFKFFTDEGSGWVLCAATTSGSGIVHRFHGTQAQTDLWFTGATEGDLINI